MNKDPVIERMIAVNELTEILCGKPCDICSFYGQRTKCMPVYTAEKIVDAGWRKASDVAEEIFEQIDDTMDLLCAMTGVDVRLFGRYAELRKMFMEVSNEETDE